MMARHELHKLCMLVTMGKLSCTNIRGLKGENYLSYETNQLFSMLNV